MDASFKKAIKIVHERLSSAKINYALIGSTNMQLQGIDIIPKDLDIVVCLKELSRMKELFPEYGVSDIRALKPLNNKPAWEVKLVIEGVEVQILGEEDDGNYVSVLLKGALELFNVDGVSIPCFRLVDEERVYRQTGRVAKAERIRKELEAK